MLPPTPTRPPFSAVVAAVAARILCYTGAVPIRRVAAPVTAALSALLALLVLPSCAPAGPAVADTTAFPVTSATAAPTAAATPPPTPTPQPTPVPLRVAVRAFHEPDDHAHRNYCGAGATEVLVSAWTPVRPDLEAVARAIHLDPDSGATGADTVQGINALLQPALARDRYRGDHVTALDGVLQRLRADLGSADDLQRYGHTAPVMVQAMTKTLPGWRGWQATHMITISAAHLDSGNPDVDTVTYAETPSPIAGYNGPDFQTITVHALWTAMQAFLVDDPRDVVNVIW
jgi:hypothetical protein